MPHADLHPPGTLSYRTRSHRFETIVLQIALFAFYKTRAAAAAAETTLKMAVNTVSPPLTAHRVASGLQNGSSECGTSCRGALSVTTC